MALRLGIFAFLIVALLAVLLFGYSVMNTSKPVAQQSAAPPPPTTEHVLVTAGGVTGGQLLAPGDITAADVLLNQAPEGALIDTPTNRAELVGAMARRTMPVGAALTDSEVIHPGDHSFLAAALKPGMRAVTVAVDTVTGSDGLIWPGDYVDVLLTQTIAGAPDAKSIAAEMVLSDVRVIATGADLIKAAGMQGLSGPTAGTVTLEVSPDQAARCLVASSLGKLSLIVHSATQNAQDLTSGSGPIWAGDVSSALTIHANAPNVSTVKVFQGSPDEQDYKF